LLITDLPVSHKIISKLQEFGFSSLTDIQEKCIAPALLGKDILACSQTGSGKTFAFLVPSIHRLLNSKALSKQDPRALILAPTRELAKQVFLETKKLCSGTKLNVSLIVGGENYNDQAKMLKRSPDIVIGTAGRIFDHLQSKHFFLNGLELLVLDEADRMLDLGFSDALIAINRYADHRKRQTLLFSATLDHPDVLKMANRIVKAPVHINVGLSTQKHEQIQQSFYFAESLTQKEELLNSVLEERSYNQAIVFTATREDTTRLALLLNEQNARSALALSGDLLQKQRSAILSGFSRGQYSILVTTDLASRGLDLRKVGLVINFDLPKQADEYIHRIGRTGRAGESGEAVSLVGKKDWQSFVSIRQHIDYEIACGSHPSHPSRFTGLKHTVKSKLKKTSSISSNKKTVNTTLKKTKRINTQVGSEAGHIPIPRKIKQ
jgi:superfamily II DNA/RNA helicase